MVRYGVFNCRESNMLSAITTRTMPATERTGIRVKAEEAGGRKILRAWDHSRSAEQNHYYAARSLWLLLEWHNIGPLLGGCLGGGKFVWVMDNPASRLP